MWCGSYVSLGDTNGTLTMQYYCGAVRTIPWGFLLSAGVPAIVVGNVSENGLIWWVNG